MGKKNRANFSLISGCSVDGRITDRTGRYSHWSSREDKIFLDAKMRDADCFLVADNVRACS